MSKHTSELRVSTDASCQRLLAMLGLGLVLILPLSYIALDYIVPKSLSPDRGAFTRAAWYLHSGQWHADVRTLICAVEFMIDSDTETVAATKSPTQQLTTPSRPVGPNPPAVTQSIDGGHRLPNS